MSAEGALLFIDAHIYLDLYRRPHEQRVLDQLATLSTTVFCTKQVVEEVGRNKQEVAALALEQAFKQVEMPKIEKSLPQHLLNAQQVTDLGKLLPGLLQYVAGLNQKLNEWKKDLKKQIDRQEDPVSRMLASIFQNSVPHSDADLERARERRDRGNPPG